MSNMTTLEWSATDNVNPYFYYFYVQSSFFSDLLSSVTKTSAQSGVYMQDILNLTAVRLPLIEQNIIIKYLADKTAQIDALIEKKQRMIELLKEYRTAVITHAVTKGLNPNVKMKDSGIEWIGEIPEGWEVKPLKHVVLINCISLPETTVPGYKLRYIDIGNVEHGKIINQPQELIFSEAPSRARRIVKQGDTIVSTVRTYLKAIAFIDSQEENLIVSTGFAVLSDSTFLLPKFAFYIVSAQKIVDTICAMSVGVNYPAITATDLGTISVWYPNKGEQTSIASYLDRKTQQIDALIEKKQRMIESLQEYRTALISNAVTGKIDVRDTVSA